MVKVKISLISVGLVLLFAFFLLLPLQSFAYDCSTREGKQYLRLLERKFADYRWTDLHPRDISWEYHRTTRNKHPLMFVHFGNSSKNCVLFFGGVHGDELPTAYLMFKLAHYVKEHPALFKDQCIVIAPLLNPDGFLSAQPTRTNASGIDINRNFPTRDWKAKHPPMDSKENRFVIPRNQTGFGTGNDFSDGFNQTIQTAENTICAFPA